MVLAPYGAIDRVMRLLLAADILGRFCLCSYYALVILGRLKAIQKLVAQESLSTKDIFSACAEASIIAFLAVICIAVIVRLPPVRSVDGVEPYVTAMIGTFLLGVIAYLPAPMTLPVTVHVVALVLVTLGCLLSMYVVFWLGRSISIVPEARRLVTGGPYSVVRHPLYLTEEIAIVGVVLQHLSVWAVLLGIVHWCIQMRRMTNEERILSTVFPHYADYAKRVPRIIPYLFGKGRQYIRSDS